MEELPKCFLDIASSASIEQCKSMLVFLNNKISDLTNKIYVNKSVFMDYTHHTPNFFQDKVLKDIIISEVESLGIINKKSTKVTTQWLTPDGDNRDYCFSESQKFKHPPKPLTQYPGICKLLESVNAHSSTTHDLDSALIMGYNKNESALNFHHDGEKLIDQSGSIAVVSFGEERLMEFCRQGGPREPEFGFPVCNGDLTVMRPGCQQRLLHRICQGFPEAPEQADQDKTDNWRFSISFRKVSPLSTDHEISFDIKDDKGMDKTQFIAPTPRRKICLIAGDSYTAGLDPVKLGRNNRKIVKNVSCGGAKIEDVSKQLDKFFVENREDIVDKVFICVGTNDIRFCKDSGVKHLRGKLLRLVDKVKFLFPGAKLWFQNLLPLPIQNPWTVGNVESYNKMLHQVCVDRRVFYLNCFTKFLEYRGNGVCVRYEPLFIKPINNVVNIHPNSDGMSILASKYLAIIHNRNYNPQVYN